MRALPALGCSANFNLNGILAVIRYDGSDPTALPNSTAYVPSDTNCEDETGLVPVVPKSPGIFSEDGNLNISIIPNNGLVTWTINLSQFFINYSDPTLLLVEDHNPKYPDSYNVVSLNGTDDTVIPLPLIKLLMVVGVLCASIGGAVCCKSSGISPLSTPR
jgi:hypothetical protein